VCCTCVPVWCGRQCVSSRGGTRLVPRHRLTVLPQEQERLLSFTLSNNTHQPTATDYTHAHNAQRTTNQTKTKTNKREQSLSLPHNKCWCDLRFAMVIRGGWPDEGTDRLQAAWPVYYPSTLRLRVPSPTTVLQDTGHSTVFGRPRALARDRHSEPPAGRGVTRRTSARSRLRFWIVRRILTNVCL